MRGIFLVVVGLLLALPSMAAAAESGYPPEVRVVKTQQPFAAYLVKLKAAIGKHGMGIVGEACATCGAKSIGVSLAGNRVIMIFNPHFAVRMLKASIPAGIEAPLRLYVVEARDSTAVLSYKPPSQIFAPYDNADLNAMAEELDQIVAAIVLSAAE